MIHRAKKSLGQNFLKSGSILKKIVEAGEISLKDTVLEIGPGKGSLTEKLLEQAGKVIAVEKDRELFVFLKEKFSKEISDKKLTLIEGDILKFNPGSEKYKIVANIPYNITGAILKKFLTEKTQPSCMVLLLQYEVAKRIVAGDEKESMLSISVKAYGKPKTLMKVPGRFFSPAPKVDSALLVISDISRKFFEENNLDEEKFWKVVKKGFSHKRKKLSGNLKGTISKEKILSLGLSDKRAENLKLSDWKRLAYFA